MGKQLKLNLSERGKNSKRASKILKENRAEYQQLLKSEIKKQSGKKNVCKAAKAASKQHKKMTWKQALKLAK